jgi:hypothetical protein
MIRKMMILIPTCNVTSSYLFDNFTYLYNVSYFLMFLSCSWASWAFCDSWILWLASQWYHLTSQTFLCQGEDAKNFIREDDVMLKCFS